MTTRIEDLQVLEKNRVEQEAFLPETHHSDSAGQTCPTPIIFLNKYFKIFYLNGDLFQIRGIEVEDNIWLQFTNVFPHFVDTRR